MLKCTALLRRNLKSITKPLLKNLENNKLNTRELEENKDQNGKNINIETVENSWHSKFGEWMKEKEQKHFRKEYGT